MKGRELSQGESLLITGFDSASRQPPPFEGKAWELSPLGMIRSPCLFYRARVLPALTLECSSQTPLFIMSWWSSRVPALERFTTHTALFDLSSAGRTTAKQLKVVDRLKIAIKN